MSRHRDVRTMNIDEEYEGYYDSAYGHSVEEDFCISPRTEAQFLYNRDAQKHSMSAFLGEFDSQLGDSSSTEDSSQINKCSPASERQNLSILDATKLQSCVEAMQNVVGDTVSESTLVKAATRNGLDVEKALNEVLSGSAKLQSCVEAMQNVVGDTVSESTLVKAATRNGLDVEKALNEVLSGSASETPKPPRSQTVVAARKAKLQSCVEAMQNVVGDTVSESTLVKAATRNGLDVEKALNEVLSGSASETPKPPRSQTVVAARKVSSSTIEAPDLETVEDDSDLISNREIRGRIFISNGEIKPLDDLDRPAPENSTKKKFVVEGDDTNCKKAAEKPGMLLSDVVEEKTSKKDELSGPIEIISQLKNDANYKEVLDAYKRERGGDKPLINLVVVGHVDAGKSTLMGHLLYRLGCVARRVMHKYEQDSKKLGKSSFMYAWVLDETSEERNRGITMDVAQSRFETPHRTVTLLDAPGHKDFIPNMITGAAQADVAVLVLDSTRGEFETGFEAGGQTREHTMLIRSLGVGQLAVAVNKLDNVNWDQERYKEIVSKLSAFLKQAGFKETEVQFVPCSGLTGENLVKPPETPELKEWYSGPCLVDVIDSFKPPERPISKPFRFCISDVFKGMGSGLCVSGKIEAGYIQNGDKVLIMPAAEQAAVKGITIDDTSVQHSFAGDYVTLQLSGIDVNNMTTGCVVCEIARPVKVSAHFQARLVVFNTKVPIIKGFPVIIHYQSMSEQACVKKLTAQLHRSTGQVIKKKPRCLAKNTSAIVEIEVIRPICLEVYKDFKELGRFMLRYGGSTIAAGLVTEIF